MPNPSEKSVSGRCARYLNHGHELSPEAAAVESVKIDESRLYLITRLPPVAGRDESLGEWRKRAPMLAHLQHAVDTGLLVGGVPRVLIDTEYADRILGRTSAAQLTLNER